ncbi:ubiquitin-protein ligase E3A-like [Strongylocentrotus purpuratus]|uniref:HECT-type E3 ubiquitin transferase n=1 Tax=Strongylocentrotus purpuratus TaxID=7668 RepID=A0A7M7NRM2_STRPU|nr:ubiquitin-protein ligase E3A-like [Strongylocentrotus purpuratus]
MFWEVFHALDDDQKREFLVFVAGSDRVPVGGLENLGLTIVELIPDDVVDDPDDPDDLCPVAHCCNNDKYNRTLELPMYTSKELVKDRLMTTLSLSNCPFHIA